MVRILQIIFGLDAVARELRIARHALVFFEQLRGVAALAVVLSVPRLAAEVRSPLSSTAAPAAALTIIDQNSLP
jgi:NhaP-type Na+/H+ or K+/H+ antiporter